MLISPGLAGLVCNMVVAHTVPTGGGDSARGGFSIQIRSKSYLLLSHDELSVEQGLAVDVVDYVKQDSRTTLRAEGLRGGSGPSMSD